MAHRRSPARPALAERGVIESLWRRDGRRGFRFLLLGGRRRGARRRGPPRSASRLGDASRPASRGDQAASPRVLPDLAAGADRRDTRTQAGPAGRTRLQDLCLGPKERRPATGRWPVPEDFRTVGVDPALGSGRGTASGTAGARDTRRLPSAAAGGRALIRHRPACSACRSRPSTPKPLRFAGSVGPRCPPSGPE